MTTLEIEQYLDKIGWDAVEEIDEFLDYLTANKFDPTALTVKDLRKLTDEWSIARFTAWTKDIRK